MNMTPQERIEEAHGLWEIAIVRLAALVEAGADKKTVALAIAQERAAFGEWTYTSSKAVKESETP